MVSYPAVSQNQKRQNRENRKREKFLKVIRDALSEDLCERVYDYTTKQKQPWGEYVSLKEIKATSDDSEAKRMAKEIVRSLYVLLSPTITQHPQPPRTQVLREQGANGVLVGSLGDTRICDMVFGGRTRK